MEYINKILLGNNLEIMAKIPDNTFDFCFADPPYFMQIDNSKKLYRVEGTEFDGVDDEWDKFESMDAYKDFTRKWLAEVRRILKPNGTICLISGMQSIYEIGSILRDLGFWVINDIIWKKSNPTPNFGGTRLNNSHETLIWAGKSKKTKYKFNYKTGKYLNGGKQMGSIWEFPVASGNERVKDKKGKKLHNTQKPEALLYRIITLFTEKGDLILDPFGGTMTTGAVAKQTGRGYTMIELDSKYVEFGKLRIDTVKEEIGDVENAIYDIKPLRVSMKEMIEQGFFVIGEQFVHKNGMVGILATEDGKLKYNDKIDSMHTIAGLMMGSDMRKNGFDFFYVYRNGQLVSIDDIRGDYRKIKEKNLNK